MKNWKDYVLSNSKQVGTVKINFVFVFYLFLIDSFFRHLHKYEV